LYSALSEDDRDTMREAHEMTKQSHPEVTAEFAALGPKDKFILVAITSTGFSLSRTTRRSNADGQAHWVVRRARRKSKYARGKSRIEPVVP
jgi:hypothetical protein